jgi:prevent-host-death family protein
MKTVTATEFKSPCLALLEEVQRTRTRLLVTRHGKPVAEIAPHSATAGWGPNPLKGSILHEDDLVSPIASDWNSAS